MDNHAGDNSIRWRVRWLGVASELRPLLLVFGLLVCTIVQATPHQVFIASDSTAAEYGPERAPQAGWGQMLQSYLDPAKWQVRNHARGGRSARSFIDEGRLDSIAGEIGPGDVLLIQFGHNDAKFEDPTRYDDPKDAYPRYLQRYVALARDKGATPILITPPARLLYDYGALLDTHGLYTESMQALAAREQVGLIDLNAMTMAWIRSLGEQAAKPYFMFVPEQGKADGTHFSRAGASVVACLVVRGWVALQPPMAGQLQRDIDCVMPVPGAGEAPASSSTEMAPSPQLIHERDVGVEQPGPHGGPGMTVGYPFFAGAPGLSFVLRKRVLLPGSGIGPHLHHKDEIYYIVSGQGLYAQDGQHHVVAAGDAMLTRPGSTHALLQTGDAPLVVLLAYPVAPNRAEVTAAAQPRSSP